MNFQGKADYPEYNTFLLKSYNRPEFMVEPVKISVDEFSKVFDK